MNILITGGCGFLGSVIAPKLANLPEVKKITIIDNFLYKQWHVGTFLSTLPKIELRQGNVNSSAYIRLAQDSDVIIPLAAIVGMPACNKNEELAINTNQTSIQNLVKKLSSQLIIYPNTNSAYGTTPQDVICDENYPLNPISLYSETKLKGEEAILSYNNSIGLRLATVYGLSPRLRLDLLVNDFCFQATRNLFLDIYEGNYRRNYLSIIDLADLFCYIIQNREKFSLQNTYNVGNDEDNRTKYDLAKEICEYNSCVVKINENKKDNDARDYAVSSKKLYQTGFKPQVKISDQIPIISDYFRYNLSNADLSIFKNV